MRIPNRILEHPIEVAIAGLLLLGLLVGSGDFGQPAPDLPSATASQP